MRATTQDGTYPRPLMCRERWTSLDGTWEFAADDLDEGLAQRWNAGGHTFPERIAVPYPPESPASGIGRTGFHPVVWYRRTLPTDALDGLDGHRLLVHFGAVDHRARVWCDGQLVATHEGGQTPFTADVTDALDASAEEHTLVVRAEDDPVDPHQARGKQDWRERQHGIWYDPPPASGSRSGPRRCRRRTSRTWRGRRIPHTGSTARSRSPAGRRSAPWSR